jgi:Pyruvate/2-oxoacid:ferredoxin oxidoreductase delta subunit
MKIDRDKCIGCESCIPYCPMAAIRMVDTDGEPFAEIDQDECVECDVCRDRARVCPVDAIYMPELQWPRSIRVYFSNPHQKHPTTDEQGRGTGEMKTNDVTGRYRRGVSGIAMEMGRPGIGTTLKDIQTVTAALGRLGVVFETDNPVTDLMTDKTAGIINPDVLNEKILSGIIEFKVENTRLKPVLEAVKAVSKKIDTVFSLDLINRVDPDGTVPTDTIVKAAGFIPRPNTKTNVGLGRPLAEES